MLENNDWKFVVSDVDSNATDNPTFNCTFLINPSNRTYIFDEGWLTVPETVVFNLVLFFVSIIAKCCVLRHCYSLSATTATASATARHTPTNFSISCPVFPYNIHTAQEAGLGQKACQH